MHTPKSFISGSLLALALALPAAGAAAPAPGPVSNAVGLRVTELGLDFVAEEAGNRDLAYYTPRFEKPEVLCYDVVGVNDVNITGFLGDIDLELVGTSMGLDLVVNVPIVEMTGELEATDSDFWDACPSFTSNIDVIRFTGVTLHGQVFPWVDADNNLHVEFVVPPELTFEDVLVDVDPLWDEIENLIFSWDFVQDFIGDKINDVLQEKVPELLADSALQAMFESGYGKFDYSLAVSDIGLDEEGANFLLDVGLSSSAPLAPCAAGATPPVFAPSGPMALGFTGDTSMLEVSLSDAIVDEALWVAWSVGLLCMDTEHENLAAFDTILSGLGASGGDGMRLSVTVGSAPTIHFDTDIATVNVNDFLVEAYSSFAGEEQLLFRIDADLALDAVLGLDSGTNQVVLAIDALSADFRNISSEVIFADNPNAEEDLISFVTGFVLPMVQSQFTEIPVSNAIIYAADYVVLFDELRTVPGHALGALTIYRADDPSLDHTSPDTFFTDAGPAIIGGAETAVSFDGIDDRPGGLLFAYKVDDGGWSSWSDNQTAEITALTAGTHTIYVKARDGFLNEDPTPAATTIQVEVGSDSEDPGAVPTSFQRGCACDIAAGRNADTGNGVALLVGLALLGLVVRRRKV